MRVLVTGGAGYVGSVVVEELVRAGREVVVYDDLSSGRRDAVDPSARFVHADLLDRETLERTLRDSAIEAVVHMAGDSLVGESMRDPAKYHRRNVVASLVLFDAMRAARIERVVFSSSAAVYGEPERSPIDETFPTAPSNPYGETKLAVERALSDLDQAHGVRHVSLRYFNAAGAGQRCGERHDPETHLVPIVLDVARGRLRELAVFGDDYPTRDGTCVRDYVHVVDLARAHVLALDALAGGAKSTIYNLGCGGDGHTVLEVVDVARRVTGRPIATRMQPRRAGDPAVLVASHERITSTLGWRPAHRDLAAIIESAWRWSTTRTP